jgi:hypothetical protein
MSGFSDNITEIVSGTANGVDRCGEEYAKSNNIAVKKFPAQWDNIKAKGAVVKTNKYGKKYNVLAGFWRNKEMAEYADALIAIVKNDSPGTNNMIEIAKENGLEIYIYEI